MEDEGNADMRGGGRVSEHNVGLLSIFNFKVSFFQGLQWLLAVSPLDFCSQISHIASSVSVRLPEIPQLKSRWISFSEH